MPLNFKSKLMAFEIWFKWMVDAKGNDSQMQNFFVVFPTSHPSFTTC